jgi:hypothetical protein
MARPEIVHTIDADSDLSRRKLCALGIPAYDIVRVSSNDKEQPFVLGGDRDAIMSENHGGS